MYSYVHSYDSGERMSEVAIVLVIVPCYGFTLDRDKSKNRLYITCLKKVRLKTY